MFRVFKIMNVPGEFTSPVSGLAFFKKAACRDGRMPRIISECKRHPVAAAAAIAALDVYAGERLFERAPEHALLRGCRTCAAPAPPCPRHPQHRDSYRHRSHVTPPGAAGRRAHETFSQVLRVRRADPHHTRHHCAVTPLIIDKPQLDTLFGTLGEVLDTVNL